jgi:hypothetical protein
MLLRLIPYSVASAFLQTPARTAVSSRSYSSSARRSRIARGWPLREAAASSETCGADWCRSGAPAAEMTSRTRVNRAVT